MTVLLFIWIVETSLVHQFSLRKLNVTWFARSRYVREPDPSAVATARSAQTSSANRVVRDPNKQFLVPYEFASANSLTSNGGIQTCEKPKYPKLSLLL